jgi:lysophospholipase L1-like esterase
VSGPAPAAAGSAPPAGVPQPDGMTPSPRKARRRSLGRRLRSGLLASFGALLVAAALTEGVMRLKEPGPGPLFVHAHGRVHVATDHPNFVPVNLTEVPDRPRIAWLGASTIVGVPYEPVLSPPRWLGLALEQRGVKAEVVSVAAPGLASAGMPRILPEVLALHPAALVIAAGHNEYLAATELLRDHWWDDLRLVQLVRHWSGTVALSDELLPSPEHDFDRAAITAAFRQDIHDMQALADRAGVPLLLCAEVSNLADFPPVLGDEPFPDETADAAFARGQSLLAAGDEAGALAALQRARDRDGWPHRASTELNDAVAAEAHHFVALDRLFAAQSTRGVPGFDLFADHCHPTPAGQRLMAIGIADALQDLDLFPFTGTRGDAPPLEEGLRLFGADKVMFARADAQIGRAFTGFALMRGTPGPLADVARRILQGSLDAADNRAGEVLASLALLDLLDGNRVSARERIVACKAQSPEAIKQLQHLYDGYPWVHAVFERNGVDLRHGVLRTAAP